MALPSRDERLLDSIAWEPALDKYARITNLTVQLYNADGRLVFEPVNPTPLVDLLKAYGPSLFVDCARRCLAQREHRSPEIIRDANSLGVVGIPLEIEGRIVGAAVAGYVLVDFTHPNAMHQLAREAGVSFARLWQVARREQPVPERRLVLYGELLQVLGDALLRDTQRIRQLEEMGARLREVASAKDEFLAMLSHELRSPLTPILAWVQILKSNSDEASNREAVDVIERNARLQAKLVEDLLDLNRIIRGKIQLDLGLHDLNDVIHAAWETVVAAAAKKNLRVEVTQAGDPVIVEGDAGRLQQIFRNILSNAEKFTPEHGRIGVVVAREGDQAVVRITDTGEGISPGFLPFVFDVFRQNEEGTRRRHSGLGIGLALVKRLTEVHKGQVNVESPGEGRGTTVTVKLPVVTHTRDAASMVLSRTITDSAPLRNLAVLLVEDSDDTRKAIQRLLQALGARVLVARDGLEALELVARDDLDLVFCDLRMPRMDGFEFIRELHRDANRPDLPVVALSGLASDTDHERTRIAGFEAHIDKPFDDTKLVRAADLALRRRLQ